MLAVYRAYERALAKRPFITQALSAGALAATADVLTQNVVEKRWHKGEYSGIRTVRFATLILFWIAPITYRWFLLLEKLKGKPNLLPLKRMIIDQSMAAPTFTFTFITNLHLLERKPFHEALGIAKKEIIPVMKTNYRVWPAVQLVNFYLLPLRYRLVFVQFVGLFWNMYLSYATQAESQGKSK